VIGEYERAFYGGQYASMAPLFEHDGIQLWTPEVGGRIDFHAEDHEETMLALGLQSKQHPSSQPSPRLACLRKRRSAIQSSIRAVQARRQRLGVVS
jgi:hypothetical protein